jgi:hypothetical protein
MFDFRCLTFPIAVLIAASLSSGGHPQNSFDDEKIRQLPSQGKPTPAPQWGSAFKQQVERCWKKPFNATNESNIEAEFTIRLKRDGTLDEPPVQAPAKTPVTPYLQAYQESARRALVECQSYNLPADQFDQWKRFNPVFLEPKTPPPVV